MGATPSTWQGALWALAPASLLLVARHLPPPPLWGWSEARTASVQVFGGLVLAFAARRLSRAPAAALQLAGIGAGLIIAPSLFALTARPAEALMHGLALSALLVWLGPERRPPPEPAGILAAERRARSAAAAALGVWLLAGPAQFASGPLAIAAAYLSFAVCTVFAARWARHASGLHRAVIASAVCGAAWLGVAVLPARAALGPLVIGALAVLLASSRLERRLSESTPQERLLDAPSRILVVTFGVTAFAGGLTLALPIAAEGTRIAFIDALFTAVSALCVTGLGVVDTASTFSTFGELTILLLIQAGGLGMMTFSTAAVLFFGGRLRVRQEGAIASLVGAESRGQLRRALRRMLAVTFASEAIGAMILAILFWVHGDTVGAALWRGAFTSISAFCNAGFALQPDSLVRYNGDPLVLYVVALLIAVGGLGPMVVVALPEWWNTGRATLHARLVVATSALLTVGPALLFAIFEWRHSLAALSVGDRIHNAIFQSVTLRTAGFNSVDYALLHPATVTLMILVMFVGGSPGSTAGGAKTTTVAVMFLSVVAAIRGRAETTAFGRRIPATTISESAAIVTMGLGSVIVAVLLLQLTQDLTPQVALFEAVSALATVGLTIGGTGQLDATGKLIVIVCMFAGRVGPLTLLLFLAERSAGQPASLPEERVLVG